MFWLSQVTRMFWVRSFHFSDKNINRDVVCTILKVPKYARKLEMKEKLFCVIQFLGIQKDAFLEWVKNSSAPRWLLEVQWSDINTLECFPWFNSVKYLMLSSELVTAATSSDLFFVSKKKKRKNHSFPTITTISKLTCPQTKTIQNMPLFPWGSTVNNTTAGFRQALCSSKEPHLRQT